MSGIGSTPAISFRGTTFPMEPFLGMLFFKLPENTAYYWDGASWVSLTPGLPIPHGSTHTEWGSDPIPFIEALEEIYSCHSSLAPGNIVYQDAPNHVNLASSDDVSKTPAIGIIREKPTPITAKVITQGCYSGLTGLVPGKVWVGLNGALISVAPEKPIYAVLQLFGLVKSSTELQVNPEDRFIL